MRLLNYGLGEILDRIGILTLKIQHGLDQKRDMADLAHFARERSGLWPLAHTHLRRARRARYAIDVEWQTLTMTNTQLWTAEDTVRRCRRFLRRGHRLDAAMARALAILAMRIQRLNDRRAACIQAINHLAGDAVAPEKLEGR